MPGDICLALDVGDKFIRVARVADAEQPRLIESPDGAGFPSEFWYNGVYALFGAEAVIQREVNPRSMARRLSGLLEESKERRVGAGATGDASTLLGVLVRRYVWRPALACLLAEEAVTSYGEGLGVAVVVPPDMKESARAALRRGLRLGGMNVRLLVEEWQALAQSYGGEGSLQGLSLGVDLGRSLKLSLLDGNGRDLRLRAFRREENAGGGELELHIRRLVLRRLEASLGRDDSHWPPAWKQEFATTLEGAIREILAGERSAHVVRAGGASVEIHERTGRRSGQRAGGVDLYLPILARASDISSRISRFLKEMEVPEERVDRVLFCGGAAHYPFIVDMLREQVRSYETRKDWGVPLRNLLVLGTAEYAVVHEYDDPGAVREALAEAQDAEFIRRIECKGNEWPDAWPAVPDARLAPMEKRRLLSEVRHLEIRLESDFAGRLVTLVAGDENETEWAELGSDGRVMPEAEQLSDGTVHVQHLRRGGRTVEFQVESVAWPREPHFRIVAYDSLRGQCVAEVTHDGARVEPINGRLTVLRLYSKAGEWRAHNPLLPLPERPRQAVPPPRAVPTPIPGPPAPPPAEEVPSRRSVVPDEVVALGEKGTRRLRALVGSSRLRLEVLKAEPARSGAELTCCGLSVESDGGLAADLEKLQAEEILIRVVGESPEGKGGDIAIQFDGEDGQCRYLQGAKSRDAAERPVVILRRRQKRWTLRIKEMTADRTGADEPAIRSVPPARSVPAMMQTVGTAPGWSARPLESGEKLSGDGIELPLEAKQQFPESADGKARVRLVGYDDISWRTWLIVERRAARKETVPVEAGSPGGATVLELALDLEALEALEIRIVVGGWRDRLKGVTVYGEAVRLGRFKLGGSAGEPDPCAVLRFYWKDGKGWRFERMMEKEKPEAGRDK